MKTCVIIASHMRTFARCLPTIKWHVLRHFPNPTFIVSTVNDADAQTVNLLKQHYPDSPVHVQLVDSQPELPIAARPTDPTWTLGRMYSHEPYAISVHPQAVLRQLWQWQQAWDFMVKQGVQPHADFDTYLRIRPDSWFRDFRKPAQFKKYAFSDGIESMASVPWWGRFGGINDRFAILGTKAAEAYFTTYSRVPELLAAGCPLHPESLVRASLELSGCDIDDSMWADFAKLNKDGTFREPEITTQDLAFASR